METKPKKKAVFHLEISSRAEDRRDRTPQDDDPHGFVKLHSRERVREFGEKSFTCKVRVRMPHENEDSRRKSRWMKYVPIAFFA